MGSKTQVFPLRSSVRVYIESMAQSSAQAEFPVALQDWFDDLETNQRELIEGFFRRRMQEEGSHPSRREPLDVLADEASRRRGEVVDPRRGEDENLRRSEQLDGERRASNADRNRCPQAGERRPSGSADNAPAMAGGDRFEDDGWRYTEYEEHPSMSTRRSRARERTDGFHQRQARHQSVYETASESDSLSRSPKNHGRAVETGDKDVVWGASQQRRGSRSPVEKPFRETRQGRARVSTSPTNRGKKSNSSNVGNFNAGQLIGKFDGKSEPLEVFLAKFEGCAKHLGWSDEDRQFHLRLCLSGAASQILWDSCGIDSADKIVELLKNRFSSLGQTERWRTELKVRRRKPNESLQDLYSDVLRLFTLAYPKANHEMLALFLRDAFLDSLNNQQLYVKIAEKEPANIDEALHLAMRFEAYDRSFHTTEQPKSESDFNHIKPKYVRVAGSNTGETISAAVVSPPQAGSSSVDQASTDKLTELVDKINSLQLSMRNQNRQMELQKSEISNLTKALNSAISGPSQTTKVETNAFNSAASSGDGYRLKDRSRKRNFAEVVCYRCGAYGHISRNCLTENSSPGHADPDKTTPKQARVRRPQQFQDYVYLSAKL